MLIPGVPTKRERTKLLSKKLSDFTPFSHMAGKQIMLGCAREALLVGIRLLDSIPKIAHVPAYCCRSVLAPLQKMGIQIKFYDVGDNLEPIIHQGTLKKGDLFLLVHYFGILQDVESIRMLCEKFGVVLVEDCAHALPAPDVECPMGSVGAFSIFSLRKQLPVIDGGVLVLNDKSLQMKMAKIPRYHMEPEPIKKRFIMWLDRFAYTVGWPNTLILKDRLRGKLQSTDAEFYSRLDGELKPIIADSTIDFIAKIDLKRICRSRRQNYFSLLKRLSAISGVTIPWKDLPKKAVPQAFPVQVQELERVRWQMRKKGIGVDRWPGIEFPYQVCRQEFPGAWRMNKKVLLLPGHQDLTTGHIDFCTKVLEDCLHG